MKINLFLSYKERAKHNVVAFSKILPNNQISTARRIKLRVQEMTMNEKLTMIGLMKTVIICCVPVQIPYLGNFCSWDMSQTVLSQTDCWIFSLIISPEQINKIAWFYACWYKFTKIRSWSKKFWVDMVKNRHSLSGHRTQEWIEA